jgi:hypothetical protein
MTTFRSWLAVAARRRRQGPSQDVLVDLQASVVDGTLDHDFTDMGQMRAFVIDQAGTTSPALAWVPAAWRRFQRRSA